MTGRLTTRAALAVAALVALPFVALASERGVSFTSPLDGETVEGVIEVTGTAVDEVGITSVRLRVDDGEWQPAEMSGPETEVTWRKTLDVRRLVDGPHVLTASARNAGGETHEASVTVVVTGGLDTDLVADAVTGRDTLAHATTLVATVTHRGTVEDLTGVVARFEGLYKGEWHHLGSATFDIAAGETKEVERRWSTLGVVGELTVRVVVDPDDDVTEVDPTNNEARGRAHLWTDAIGAQDVTDPDLADPTPPATHTVLMLGHDLLNRTDAYGPHVTVVRVGDAVQWTNVDPRGIPHSASRARWDEQKVETGPVAFGATSAPFVLTEAGTYVYYCDLHQKLSPGPTSTIVVLPRTTG